MASTPIWSVQSALETLFRTDSQLGPLISGTYSVMAPSGTSKPYIVLSGTFAETTDSFRKSSAHNGREILHIWGRDKKEAIDLYDHVFRLLHQKRFSIAGSGFAHLGGRCRLMAIAVDEDGVSYQAVVEYTYTAA